MLSAQTLKTKFEKVFRPPQASALAAAITDAYSELVKTSDFNELKGIVKELAIAQQRTEARVEELAGAQRELAESQKELVVAQRKTEEEIRKLTQAQLGTEKKVDRMNKNLGGLSHTVGYHLEDRAYKTLPLLLKRDFNMDVEGRLIRQFFVYGKGKQDEVNIYGKGLREGNAAFILGESKAQLSRSDIDDFLLLVKRVTKHTRMGDEAVILIAVSYSIEPVVQEYAKQKKIKVYWSYELDI